MLMTQGEEIFHEKPLPKVPRGPKEKKHFTKNH